jgi:hypothetical protein
VAEGAIGRGDDVIVTSNEGHISRVVRAGGKRIRIETIGRARPGRSHSGPQRTTSGYSGASG